MHCYSYIKYQDSEIFNYLDPVVEYTNKLSEEEILDLKLRIRSFNPKTIKL